MESTALLPLLFGAGLAAGFVDSIAGGGGLISLPVLLGAGLPPQDALATNKLQSSFGSAGATWHYARAGLIDPRECVLGLAVTFIAAALGALLVQQVDPDFLRRIIPFLLLGIALYVLFQPRLGAQAGPARLSPKTFAILFGLLLGFYDGFFGPGTGSFWALACVLLLGHDLTRATAHTKAMNFASNLGSLLVFMAGSHVHYGAGLVMGLGQLAGARLGSRLVIKQGTRFVRPVFITVVLALTLKLIWDNFSRG